MPGNVYLVGFMGSGKSRCAASLASSTKREAVDTDARIVAAERRPIAEIFAADGEAYFRQREREVMRELAGRDGLIVATGGGMFCDAENRRRVRSSGTSVWLDVPLEIVRQRLAGEDGRPLWGELDRLEQRALFERRAACYALAELHIRAGEDPPEGLAERILERIRAKTR